MLWQFTLIIIKGQNYLISSSSSYKPWVDLLGTHSYRLPRDSACQTRHLFLYFQLWVTA